MSIGSSFGIAVSGLNAAQKGLDVTSHNIANANTPYFKRDLINFSTQPNQSGVNTSIQNVGIKFPSMSTQLYSSLANQNMAQKYNSMLKPISDSIGSPAVSLDNAFKDFFNSFENLSNNPLSDAARLEVISKGQSLIDKGNAIFGLLNQAKNDVNVSLEKQTDKINNLATEIESLMKYGDNNGEIEAKTAELSELVGVNVLQGGKSIYLDNGVSLIQNGVKNDISVNDIKNVVFGEVGGLNKFQNEVLTPALETFPQVVNNVLSEINKQAKLGFDINGNSGSDLFLNVGGDLSNVEVLSDKNLIGASSIQGANLLNGENAKKISDLKSMVLTGSDSVSAFENGIFEKYDSSNGMLSSYNTIANNVINEYNSNYGVNLEEEAINTIKFQRMYEANAKVIQVQDEMLGTLINMVA